MRKYESNFRLLIVCKRTASLEVLRYFCIGCIPLSCAARVQIIWRDFAPGLGKGQGGRIQPFWPTRLAARVNGTQPLTASLPCRCVSINLCVPWEQVLGVCGGGLGRGGGRLGRLFLPPPGAAALQCFTRPNKIRVS